MRFTCPKCGKKYASSAEPAPGKMYRLKCKACGEPIVIRSAPPVPASVREAAAGAPGAARGSMAQPPAATPPPSAPTPPPPAEPPQSSAPTPPPPAGAAVDRAEASATPAGESSPRGFPDEPARRSPTPFPADVPTVTATELPALPPDDASFDLDKLLGAPEPEPEREPFAQGSPLAAAARASLPDGYGSDDSGVPDPLAALRAAQPASTPARPAPEPPRFASVAKPRGERSVLTLVLLGVGLVVLIGMLAVTVMRGKQADGARPPAPAASERPAPR